MRKKNKTYRVLTNSPGETIRFGNNIGKKLQAGDVIALAGELGSGKTWLSKGIASGLDIPGHEYVNSPAFDLIHEYPGNIPLYHMDFYRMDELASEDVSWMDEYLYGNGVCVVEWADRFIDRLTDEYLRIDLFYRPDETDGRELHLSAHGDKYEKIILALEEECSSLE